MLPVFPLTLWKSKPLTFWFEAAGNFYAVAPHYLKMNVVDERCAPEGKVDTDSLLFASVINFFYMQSLID